MSAGPSKAPKSTDGFNRAKAATQPGGRFLFTGQGVGLETGGLSPSGLGHQLGQIVNDVVLGGPKVDIEHNQISSDQVLRHGVFLSWVSSVSRVR
jgi:hypothetical protein